MNGVVNIFVYFNPSLEHDAKIYALAFEIQTEKIRAIHACSVFPIKVMLKLLLLLNFQILNVIH